ncbi:MAG TPA: transglycosylase SLT domain-containing protein, partial [Bacilli bacterium]|nr:transglycosylase SLT domain-containing protein [Bacilli bacterium]
KYSAKWGISPNTIKAMMSQESAGNNDNLMNILFASWEDFPITCHNFETGSDDTIVLTNSPSNYANKNYTCIEKEDLKNPITNIFVGSFILAYTSKYENGHIGASIQAYNFGVNNMAQVLEYTASKTGVSVNDILADQTNLSFMNYTRIINVGDPDYLIHVLAHTTGDEVLTFQTEEEDNDSVQILPKQK